MEIEKFSGGVEKRNRPLPKTTTVPNVPAVPRSVKANNGTTKRRKLRKKRGVVRNQNAGVPKRIGRPLDPKSLPIGLQPLSDPGMGVSKHVPALGPVLVDDLSEVQRIIIERTTGFGDEA